MESGTVKWFNDEKGYGFIGREGGAKDAFVHSKELKKAGLQDTLKEGDKLLFETEATPRGVKAINLKFAPSA